MKVYYKIEPRDIIKMIVEKYGVKDPERQITAVIDNCYMVDMSDTETPEDAAIRKIKEKMETMEGLEMIYANEGGKAIAPVDDELIIDQEARYQMLTDGMIKQQLDAGKGVAEMCKDYNLIDKKYAQRLYKRTEKIRLECASN